MAFILHPSEISRAELNILCSFLHNLFTDFCTAAIRVQSSLGRLYLTKAKSPDLKVQL